ncbi:hypothetical protein V6N13_021712 [Hibiscus sabdariffa]|uniref:Uncharacterized protein n=1 Tax=Hibiscus sabdariffa TaxID=183260 RepID=A0ABR2BAQ0_9ROSI
MNAAAEVKRLFLGLGQEQHEQRNIYLAMAWHVELKYRTQSGLPLLLIGQNCAVKEAEAEQSRLSFGRRD